jgi:hypothetical protein
MEKGIKEIHKTFFPISDEHELGQKTETKSYSVFIRAADCIGNNPVNTTQFKSIFWRRRRM